MWTGEPFPTVVESWRRLKADGHRIHVITDRAPRGAVAEAQAATIHWLELHGLEYDSITFDADKTKILDIVEGRRVIMLEDRIENVVALTAAGVETYCQRRLWNEGHDFRYVEDFAEFAALAAATT